MTFGYFSPFFSYLLVFCAFTMFDFVGEHSLMMEVKISKVWALDLLLKVSQLVADQFVEFDQLHADRLDLANHLPIG